MNQTNYRKGSYCQYKVTDLEIIRVSSYGIDVYRKADNDATFAYFYHDAMLAGSEIEATEFVETFNKQWMKIAGTLSNLLKLAA